MKPHEISKVIFCKEYDIEFRLLPDEKLLNSINRVASNPKISEFMEWAAHNSLEATINFFDFCAKDFHDCNGYHFAAIKKDDDSFLGVASITNIATQIQRGEITTWLDERYWGQGWNKKIKHLLLEFAFLKLNLNKAVFRVSTNNKASNKAHTKLSTVLEGVLRQELFIGGELIDVNYYSLLKSEYLERYYRLIFTES